MRGKPRGDEVGDDDGYVHDLEAEIARLQALLDAPPAQMSDGQGNLIPIDSEGMRHVIDDNARLRAEVERLTKVVRLCEEADGKAEAVVRAAEAYRKAEIAYAQTVLDSPVHEDDITRKEWEDESLARACLDDLLAAYRERA